MPNKLKYQKNYTVFGEPYQLVLPLNLEGLVPDDDSVRLLSHELEELDYSLLYQAYSAKGRNPAVDPKTMFKILTYAYLQNIYSSRKIETACRRDINFMWLLAGQKAPDHSTIARFRTGFLADACEDLFYQMVRRLEQSGEISKETVFIDGTKLEACANRYTFVWKRSVGKWEAKMLGKMQEAAALLNREYMQGFRIEESTRTEDLRRICRFLEEMCKEQGTVFAHGRGRRKSRDQKYLELFRRFLERQTVYDRHTAIFRGRNNYCKTDPDATFMHMKDDHMRNAQLKPGYNVQIAVDSEYIVAAEIFQDRNDVWTLIPFLEGMEKNLGFRYPSVTADLGYESEEGYTYLRGKGQTPYIKPQTYEQWKKRSFKKDISRRENMGYDEEKDTYTCHAGRKLKVSKSFLEKRQESYENIMSERGIRYRMNRSIQAGGAFGILKNDYEFQRFLLRGKSRVKLEIKPFSDAPVCRKLPYGRSIPSHSVHKFYDSDSLRIKTFAFSIQNALFASILFSRLFS